MPTFDLYLFTLNYGSFSLSYVSHFQTLFKILKEETYKNIVLGSDERKKYKRDHKNKNKNKE